VHTVTMVKSVKRSSIRSTREVVKWCSLVSLAIAVTGVWYQHHTILEISNDLEKFHNMGTIQRSQNHSTDDVVLANALSLAGTNVTEKYPEIEKELPTMWNQIKSLYYSQTTGPVILGKEGCADFRKQFGRNATVGIAGMFNSGTNAALRNIQLNIGIPGNNASVWGKGDDAYHDLNGILFQVPWWKHNSDLYMDRNPEADANILPVVVVRDPFTWRNSMCTARYETSWQGMQSSSPKFWYEKETDNKSTVRTSEIRFKLRFAPHPRTLKYESLMELWNDFHGLYLNATFPRLLVRMEDIILYLPQVIEEVRECVGAYSKHDKIEAYTGPLKPHGNKHLPQQEKYDGLLSNIVKLADANRRIADMSDLELEYSQSKLDPELMKLLQYQMPLARKLEKES
jgi:hypothetical protein